jgi:O-antigen/teichoic acid export membrane protein
VRPRIPQTLRARGRRLLRDPSALLLAAQVTLAGAAFVANILSARALGPSGRGELALLLQIAYFGSLAVVLGCDRSVVVVYQGRPLATVTRAFLRLLLRPSTATFVVVAAVLALPLPGVESWRLRLAAAGLFMVVNSWDRALRSIAIAAGRAGQYLWYEVTTCGLLLAGLGLLTVLQVTSSAAWMLAYVLAGALPGAGWLWWWSRTAAGADGTPDPDHQRRRARREGLHLLPAAVAHSGTLRLDRLILAGLASTAALGHYATVATITELITWPLLVFADSRLGLWRQAHDRGALSLRGVLGLAVAYSLVAGTVVAVALHLFLLPLLGADYADALPLVVPLVLAAAVFGISQMLVTALTATRHAPLSSVVEMVGLAVSVIAYVTLIGRFGALGAAYGSLIGYGSCLVLAALFLLVVRRNRVAPPPSTAPAPRSHEDAPAPT